MEVDPQFGVSQPDLTVLIQSTFDQWESYRKARAMPVEYFHTPKRLDPMSRCDGSEDLHFYFGATSPEVEREKARFMNPHSFAAVTAENPRDWHKGIIWFARPGSVKLPHVHPRQSFPNWAKVPNQLRGAMLHEWGHVFGCEHIEGTVMSKDIWSVLVDDPMDPAAAERRGKIDQAAEVYRDLMDLNVDVHSPLQFSDQPEDQVLEQSHQFLTRLGLNWKTTRIDFKLAPDERDENLIMIARLSDGKKEREFRATSVSIGSAISRGEAFAGSEHQEDFFSFSGVFGGQSKLNRFTPMRMELDYSMTDYPFALYFVIKGQRVYIGSFADSL